MLSQPVAASANSASTTRIASSEGEDGTGFEALEIAEEDEEDGVVEGGGGGGDEEDEGQEADGEDDIAISLW